MSYREHCDLCGESYDDDNLTTCRECQRWFCYRCGNCGDTLCLRCLESHRTKPPDQPVGGTGSRQDDAGREHEETTGQGTPSGWLLAVVEGPDVGRVCLLGEEPVAIGRGRDDFFVLRDFCVTHRQLVIEWDPITSRHILRQTGDSPTVINNIPLSRLALVKHALLEGDQIQVGATIMRYRRGLPAEDRWVCPFCGRVADLETVPVRCAGPGRALAAPWRSPTALATSTRSRTTR